MIEGAFDRALLALRRAAGDAPLSIFIDPTLRDPTAHDELLQQALKRAIEGNTATRHRLPQIHDDFDPDRHPFLIHVTSEPQAERLVAAALGVATAESLEAESPEFTGRTVSGFILRDSNPAMRARTLALAARVRKPDGRRHFLRFWDPRVCWHLPHRLPVSHWVHISQAMGQWTYFGPSCQLVTAESGNEAPLADIAPGDTTSMPMDATTWQRLERIAPTNKLLAMCRGWGLQPTAALAHQVDSLLVRSAEQGFDSEQDVLVFAACGLTGHPQFDRHPRVQDAMHRAAVTGAPLQAALAGFNETFWAQLQADTRWLTDAQPTPTLGTTKRASA